ncbi:MAG: RNA recognition motif domain-containing protein [Nitrospirota bacterium]
MATKIHVENLPCDISEERLRDIFAQIGSVESVKLETDLITRRPKCAGYVEMSLDVDAFRAVNCFDGATFKDRKIHVEEAKPFYERAKEVLMNRFTDDMTTKVFVENLPCDITEERLKDVFMQVGAVGAVKIQKDLLTLQARCSGTVEMLLDVDAYRAVNCFNGATFRDRKIHVEEAKPLYEKARELLRDRGRLLAQYSASLKKQLPKWH